MAHPIPARLRRFCIPQRYSRYTADDYWVWNRVIERLARFRAKRRSSIYPPYLQAVESLGFRRGRIPHIDELDRLLIPLGWRAVCVDGYVSPAVYADMQENRIFGVARGLRARAHLDYAPSPDMIHDVFGHLPLLLDAAYRELLDHWNLVMALARPDGRDQRLFRANRRLALLRGRDRAETEISAGLVRREQARIRAHPSLFRQLHHLSFWSLEFGVLGAPSRFSLFGAGLLSSIDEGERVLSGGTRVLRFGRAAARYDFNISDHQAQVFACPSVGHYWRVIRSLVREHSGS